MIVLNTKTFDELKEEAISDLQAVGFNTSPGAIAKLFMNIVNQNIANLYDTLTVNHIRAFVTTADGAALDAIGVLVQCFRLKDETDDNFRYRIVNQCLTLATSNETAIRLTALTVEGVNDYIETDVKDRIYKAQISENEFNCLVDASSAGNVRPMSLLELIYNEAGVTLDPISIQIIRCDLYTSVGDKLMPLDGYGA